MLARLERNGVAETSGPIGEVLGQLLAERHLFGPESVELANWGQGGIGSLNRGEGSWSTPGASADAAQAWLYSLGSGVTIADVDTGVTSNIPELAGQVSPLSENFTTYPRSSDVSPMGMATDYDHGTLVADVLAARAGNGVGATGIAPGAKVMNLKCTDGSTVSDLCVYEAGWYAIHHGAKIINLSVAFLGNDTLLDELVADAENAEVLVVVAAGNFSKDNGSYTVSPANLASKYPNVISVGASDMNDAKASFSDYGPSTVDLMAPGAYILGQEPDGSFVFANGTSFATPMVAATAALMLSEDPSLTPEQIKTDILATVDHPRSLAGLTVTGGRLDAAAAVASVQDAMSRTPCPRIRPQRLPRPPRHRRPFRLSRPGQGSRPLRLGMDRSSPPSLWARLRSHRFRQT